MSIEKQIEEMAHCLCGQKNSCAECDSDYRCEFFIESSILRKAGYRKQSEVAMEIFEEIEKQIIVYLYGGALHRKFAELKKKYTEDSDES